MEEKSGFASKNYLKGKGALEKTETFTVEIEGPNEDGDFEVVSVKINNKSAEPRDFPMRISALRSAQIHLAWVEQSPGHWCVVDSYRFWCPF